MVRFIEKQGVTEESGEHNPSCLDGTVKRKGIKAIVKQALVKKLTISPAAGPLELQKTLIDLTHQNDLARFVCCATLIIILSQY